MRDSNGTRQGYSSVSAKSAESHTPRFRMSRRQDKRRVGGGCRIKRKMYVTFVLVVLEGVKVYAKGVWSTYWIISIHEFFSGNKLVRQDFYQ